MTILDKKIVTNAILDKSNKVINCHENKEILQQLSYNSNALFNHIALEFSAYESAQIINSNDVFIKSKSKSISKPNYNNRQIIMVDLGLNFNNLSYRHPCIVMQTVKNKIFVVPCKSGPAPRYNDKITGESTDEIRDGYLEGDVVDGFAHLTTIIIKEAACIDKSQVVFPITVETDKIIKGKNRRVPCKITPTKYAEINAELHKLLFKWQDLQMEKLEFKLSELKTELEEVKKENKRLQEENLAIKEAALE